MEAKNGRSIIQPTTGHIGRLWAAQRHQKSKPFVPSGSFGIMWFIGQVLCLCFAKIPYLDARLVPRGCPKRAAFNNLYKDLYVSQLGGLPCHTHPFSPRSQRLLLSNPESSEISLKPQDPLLRQLWTRMCYNFLIPHQHGPQDSWKGGCRSRQNRQHHQESLQLSHQDDGGLAHSAGGRVRSRQIQGSGAGSGG